MRSYKDLRIETEFSENGTAWFMVKVGGAIYEAYRDGTTAGQVIDRLARLQGAGTEYGCSYPSVLGQLRAHGGR